MQRQAIERGVFVALTVVGFGLGVWVGGSYPRAGRYGTASTKTERNHGGTARMTARGEESPPFGGAVVAGEDAKSGDLVRGGFSKDALRREMLRALQAPNLTERVLLIAAAMRKLSAGNWQGMLAAVEEEKRIFGRPHEDVRLLMAQLAGEVVGREALSHFLNQGDAEATRAALTGWAIKDPSAALAWLGNEADAETRRRFIGAAIRGLALTEPDLAISELESIPIERRKNYTGRFVDSLIRTTGLDGTEKLFGGMIQRAAAAGQLKDDYLVHVFWDLAQARIEQAQSSGQVVGLADWMNKYVGQPFVHPGIVGSVAAAYVSLDPQGACQWLEAYNKNNMAAGQPTTVGYDALMAAWTQKESIAVVGKRLGELTASPYYDRMAQRYAEIVAQQDTAAALRWVGSIKDPAIKTEATDFIAKLPKKKG